MDFDVIKTNNQIHILNAQSPAATCSLAIADYIIEIILINRNFYLSIITLAFVNPLFV